LRIYKRKRRKPTTICSCIWHVISIQREEYKRTHLGRSEETW